MSETDKVLGLDPEALEAACRSWWGVLWGVGDLGDHWSSIDRVNPKYTELRRRALEAGIVAYLREVAIVVDRELYSGPRPRCDRVLGSDKG